MVQQRPFYCHTSPVSTLATWTWHNADCLCCRYHRCEFSLALERAGQGGVSPVHMSPYSKWEGVAGLFNPAERPVVLNRASSTNTTNPFGSTFCYGYQDIIFEVRILYFPQMRSSHSITHFCVQVMPNGHLASLTLYLPPGMTPYKEAQEGAEAGTLLPL